MGRFENLGAGLKHTAEGVVQTTVAYSLSTYMQSKSGTNHRIQGAYVDGRRVGALTGGTTVNFETEMRLMLGLFNYEYAHAATYAAAEVLYQVLCTAVDLAPFWLDSPKAKRPSKEGIHLRESGVVTLGAVDAISPIVLAGMYNTTSDSVGGSKGLVGSDDVKKFYTKESLDTSSLKKRGGSKLNMNVSFHRIAPDGFDVAMWTHENLDLEFNVPGTQPKYLETAFESIDVKKQMSGILAAELIQMSENARGVSVDQQAKQLVRNKLANTIKGRGEA